QAAKAILPGAKPENQAKTKVSVIDDWQVIQVLKIPKPPAAPKNVKSVSLVAPKDYFPKKEQSPFALADKGIEKYYQIMNKEPADFIQVQKNILAPAAISLPELADGDKYVYDSTKGEYGKIMIKPGSDK
ncbi:MAG: hypothetical protein N2F24_04860, partial [Deltaproteobacteria bacterium]